MDGVEEETYPETIVYQDGESTARRTTFGYVTVDHPRLDRVQNAISAVCATISALAIATLAVLTTVEVIARAAFDSPLGWNVGFVEQYLMMSIAFFGTVTAYRSGAHVAVVTIFERLPAAARKLLLIVTYLLILVSLALLIYSGTRAAHFSFVTGQASPPGMAELSWPTWWWKSIIPIAASLGLVVVIIDLYREMTSRIGRVCTDYEVHGATEGS